MITIIWFHVAFMWLSTCYFIAAKSNAEGGITSYSAKGMVRDYYNEFPSDNPFALIPITLMPIRNILYSISFIDVMLNKVFKFNK